MSETMNYEEFKEYVVDNIRDRLDDRFMDAMVFTETVIKNNDTSLDGLQIKLPEKNISPSIYLNGYYEDYRTGEATLSDTLDKIADVYINAADKQFDLPDFTELEEVRGKIIPRLINADTNSVYLEDKPFTRVEDLAIVYAVVVDMNEDGAGMVTINDRLMNEWGTSPEELHDIAMVNVAEQYPSHLESIQDTLIKMTTHGLMEHEGMSYEEAREAAEGLIPMGVPNNVMYVYTNSVGHNGAIGIMCEGEMEKIAEKVGGDFYVLPSSIHELIVVPKTDEMSYQELEMMVHEVNTTQVSPQDRLSEHVYQYDSEHKEFMRADQAELRDTLRKEVEEAKEDIRRAMAPLRNDKTADGRDRVSMKDKIPQMQEKAAQQNAHEKQSKKELEK